MGLIKISQQVGGIQNWRSLLQEGQSLTGTLDLLNGLGNLTR